MAGGHSVPGGTLDITELILDDHREQRRLFAILEQIDRADTGVLSAIWDRLASFLELHAAAEEAIFYPVLLQVGLAAHRTAGVEGETLDAIKDHNEIRDAVAEVARHQVGTDEWFGAVAGANLANSDHMAEEEREGLTDFRRLTLLHRRHQLAVAFAASEARNFAGIPAVDKDPATYVREAEEEGQEPRSGSLSIGSLKRGCPARGLSPRPDRRPVAVEDLGPVLVPRGRRPVAVQDQAPVPRVDDDQVMEPAQQDTARGAVLAAVLLVLDVVDLADGGGLVTAGEPAVLVALDNRVADPGRDGLGVADVQRQARPGQAGAELAAAEEARHAAGARQEVHGLADDAPLDRGPGLGGVGTRSAVAAEPVQFDAEADQVVKGVRVDIAGDDRGHGRVAGPRLGGGAVEPETTVPAAFGGSGAVPGPPGTDLGGPLVQQGRTPVQAHHVGQRDVRPDFDRLAGPLRHQIGGDQPLHGFLEGVVIPLGLAAVVFLPARGGQRVQHLGHHRRALRRQVSRHDAGPAESGLQPDGTVVERLVLILAGDLGLGALVDLAI